MKMIKNLVIIMLFGILSCQIGTKTTNHNLNEAKANSISEASFVSGKANNGLQLEIRFLNDSLEIKIKNGSNRSIKVCSHCNTLDLDWYAIILKDQNKNERRIVVGDIVRTGTEIHTKTLNPQQSFSHIIDLKYWSEQLVNKKEKLLPGNYKAIVTYEANDCYYPSKDYWNGKITAGPLDCKIH